MPAHDHVLGIKGRAECFKLPAPNQSPLGRGSRSSKQILSCCERMEIWPKAPIVISRRIVDYELRGEIGGEMRIFMQRALRS